MIFGFMSKAERQRAVRDERGLSREDFDIVVHPVRYLRWRRDGHKHGPYALAYPGGHAPRAAPVILLAFALATFGAAMLVIVLGSPG